MPIGPGSRTILVTSPGPGDGKTTVVANIAATFAGVGKRVIVLSCDFRRPRIHRLFGLKNEEGLVERLQSHDGGSVLDGQVKETTISGLSVVPSGSPPTKSR